MIGSLYLATDHVTQRGPGAKYTVHCTLFHSKRHTDWGLLGFFLNVKCLIGYRYVLGGFAPALVFQILCRLPGHTSPLGGDYKIRGSVVYTHTERSHTHVKNPVVHVRARWVIKTTK